jgi:hypothetical protein
MPSYYFSYDEEGHTFYENQYELIENTPRIQDCYYYEGDVSKEDIMKDDDDYREINILEHMKKENEKLKSKYHDMLGKCETAIDETFSLKEENKKLKEEIKELRDKFGIEEGRIIESSAGDFYWNYENDRPNKIEGEMKWVGEGEKWRDATWLWEIWLYP